MKIVHRPFNLISIDYNKIIILKLKLMCITLGADPVLAALIHRYGFGQPQNFDYIICTDSHLEMFIYTY